MMRCAPVARGDKVHREMPSVAIVGAGAAGLVAAKVLLKDGFDVTVFESRTTLGGVWSYEGSYYNLHTQQPGGTMEFADLYDGQEYASWEHVYGYLCAYVDKFHLRAHLRLQTRVLSISKANLNDADEPWTIEVEQGTSNATLQFDFVVVASGLFSQHRTATFRGQEKFAGAIFHATEIKSRDQLLDKKILVVGGGKSAVDMAINAATITNRCKMIFRRSHVIMPMKILRGHLPLRFVLTRFFSFFSDPYPFVPHGRLFQFAHRYFEPVFVRIRKLIACDFAASNDPELYADGLFKPRQQAKDGLLAFPVSPIFTELKRREQIRGHLTSIDEILDPCTVRLDNGEVFTPVDTIICSTGYSLRFPFFSESDARRMGLPHSGSDDLDLYRRIVPVGVPRIAFVGYISSGGSWMIDEAAAHWTSDYFQGVHRLPTHDEMRREIDTVRDFIRTRFGATAPYVRLYWLELIEIYLHDMRVPLTRTSNFLAENFGVYRPDRLKMLHEQRRARDRGLPLPSRFYFSFAHCLLILCAIVFVKYLAW